MFVGKVADDSLDWKRRLAHQAGGGDDLLDPGETGVRLQIDDLNRVPLLEVQLAHTLEVSESGKDLAVSPAVFGCPKTFVTLLPSRQINDDRARLSCGDGRLDGGRLSVIGLTTDGSTRSEEKWRSAAAWCRLSRSITKVLAAIPARSAESLPSALPVLPGLGFYRVQQPPKYNDFGLLVEDNLFALQVGLASRLEMRLANYGFLFTNRKAFVATIQGLDIDHALTISLCKVWIWPSFRARSRCMHVMPGPLIQSVILSARRSSRMAQHSRRNRRD